jgi:ABC-type dipeptide/oligopeptide/nickel transport system ATPase component
MQQRAMIAMGLCLEPQLLIADEPTTALDVTVQAQVLQLVREIRKEHRTSIFFITHDLGVVADLCDRVYVMYAGAIVEEGPVDRIFERPNHPYTRGLLRATPPCMVRKRPSPRYPVKSRLRRNGPQAVVSSTGALSPSIPAVAHRLGLRLNRTTGRSASEQANQRLRREQSVA